MHGSRKIDVKSSTKMLGNAGSLREDSFCPQDPNYRSGLVHLMDYQPFEDQLVITMKMSCQLFLPTVYSHLFIIFSVIYRKILIQKPFKNNFQHMFLINLKRII